jgi:hypothetical protein
VHPASETEVALERSAGLPEKFENCFGLRRHKRLLYHWKIDYRVQNPGATLAEAPRRLSEVRVL